MALKKSTRKLVSKLSERRTRIAKSSRFGGLPTSRGTQAKLFRNMRKKLGGKKVSQLVVANTHKIK